MSKAQATKTTEVAAETMKGIGFDNVRAYIKRTHGEDGWARLLDHMSAADRASIQSVIAVGWYDVQLFARLLRAVDKLFGTGDLSLLSKVGAYEAEQDFGRALRMLMRVVSPSQVFRAERQLWRHFQSSGEWTFTPIPGGMSGVLQNWAVNRALCVELQGYLVRLVEFSGGKEVSVDHEKCRAFRHPTCIFNFVWR